MLSERLSPELKRELGFVQQYVEAVRQRGIASLDPWPIAAADSGELPPIVSLLCRGRVAQTVLTGRVADELIGLDLAQWVGPNTMAAGRWQLTSYRGVFGVRDRPADPGSTPRVFLGDDGIRLCHSVRKALPRGTVLDVGSGSGLVTSAIALWSNAHVLGIDIVPECVEATLLSAKLNGVEEAVSAAQSNVLDFVPDKKLSCIVANLPGVPVPATLSYPAAGNGGVDGLMYSRHVLNRAPEWVQEADGVAPTLVMRLQSAGGPEFPLVLGEVKQMASRSGWNVDVVVDSRIDSRVRNALTGHYAAGGNPAAAADVVGERIREHADAIGMTHYYSLAVIARPGTGVVRYRDIALPDLLNARFMVSSPFLATDQAEEVARDYLKQLWRLPMGFWELAVPEQVVVVPSFIRGLGSALAEGRSGAEAVELLFAHAFRSEPIRSLALYSACGLLLDVLVERRLVTPLVADAKRKDTCE